jgi:hypothetical protein
MFYWNIIFFHGIFRAFSNGGIVQIVGQVGAVGGKQPCYPSEFSYRRAAAYIDSWYFNNSLGYN